MLRIEHEVIKKHICTGCGACYNACPAGAISMCYDLEGFLHPVFDETKCVGCGLCERACPECGEKWKELCHPPKETCLAAMAEDTLRMVSSSGGMFTLLALSVLEMGGSVCGAVYADDYMTVYHTVTKDEAGLAKMRGSKYVQSDTKEVYSEIQKCLEEGREVLFSGCPCQTAGLYTFLGKPYEKLYTVDLVCHGANSVSAYQSFVQESAKGRRIKEVNFRDKSRHGWSTPSVIYFEDGTVLDLPWNKTPFNTAFHGIMNRKCCGKCHYASLGRVGDITLGDFWQVHKWDPSCNDWKGTSLVLLNSPKGEHLFERIREKLKLCREAPVTAATPYNGQLVRPMQLKPGRKFFFHHLEKDGFHKALWYGQKYRYDVGLVGWWFAANYGSVLTYYALGNVLQDMDLLPILIRLPKKDGTGWEKITEENISFMSRYFPISRERKFEELGECNRFCDAFMTGSDQLWVSSYIKSVGYTFFLDFVDDRKKKIAYATSLGYEAFEGTEEECVRASAFLKNFDWVSVREISGVDACRKSFGVEAVRMLDPVFLCERGHYDILADASAHTQEKEEYLLCYILDPTPEKERAIQYVQEKLGILKKVILDMKTYDKSREIWKSGDVLDQVTIEDFLSLIRGCRFLVSDSHHGICFGLIYQKNFLCIANKGRGLTRFESLFNLLEIREHMVKEAEEIPDNEELLREVNYEKVNTILEREKKVSLGWLQEALESPCEKQYDATLYLLRKINELENLMDGRKAKE